MNYKFFNFQTKNHIAIAEFNDLPSRDKYLVDLGYEFSDMCSNIASNDEMFVLVITGEGENAFNFIEQRPYKFLNPASSDFDFPLISKSIDDLEIPVIMGMDGNVMGQGLEMALACDIRIASVGSKFGFPHLTMGIMPFEGGTQRLPRIIGQSKALEIILTGDTFDAQTGFQLGLINRVVKKEELSSIVHKVAIDMSKKGPLALNYIKEAVNKGMDLTLDQGLRLEADLYFLLHSTQDRFEGIKAFQQKRKPIFKGE